MCYNNVGTVLSAQGGLERALKDCPMLSLTLLLRDSSEWNNKYAYY